MEEVSGLLNNLIKSVSNEGASDLHLSEGRKPIIRIAGFLSPLIQQKVLSREIMEKIVQLLVPKRRIEIFNKKHEVDFAYSHKGSDENPKRFRGNVFVRQRKISMALRYIHDRIRTIDELNLPPSIEFFAKRKQGFFLVVGPTGHGKTTTLVALIDIINNERLEHIVTIEDPIEYVFEPKKSIIDQREIGEDTLSFRGGLESIFRQDADVVMIGEMRESDTISTAVTAAETGHLVFSTLHTNNAAQTVDRIIDSFPSEQQNQIRLQLSNSLTGILSQRLIPRISGGLIPAYELLINNNAVANLIREKRAHEINMIVETSSGDGMMDLNRSLAFLVQKGEITVESAYKYSLNPKILEKIL